MQPLNDLAIRTGVAGSCWF